MSTINVNAIDKESGSTLTLGTSGTTVDIPSGATLDVTGATVSGLSTWENTPNFLVSTSADQSWSSTYSKFAFTTVTSESDSGSWDTTNYKFTVPSGKGGLYLFNVNFFVQSGNNYYVKTIINGSTEGKFVSSAGNVPGNTKFSPVWIHELSAGDTIEYQKYSAGSWTNAGATAYGVRLHT